MEITSVGQKRFLSFSSKCGRFGKKIPKNSVEEQDKKRSENDGNQADDSPDGSYLSGCQAELRLHLTEEEEAGGIPVLACNTAAGSYHCHHKMGAMQPEEEKALRKCRPCLCKDLQITEVLAELEAADILTDFEKQLINAERTQYEKTGKLLEILKTKGCEAFYLFISALHETKQHHIAEYLMKSYYDIKFDEPSSSKTVKISSSTESKNLREELTCIKQLFKDIYVHSFKMTNPFSLPFTFDIERTWVSLALKEEESFGETEDHAEVLKKAFEKVKLLIVEGAPATGKTTLMRRVAYDWALGKEQLNNYDLVLYGEFRSVRDKQFISIIDLMIAALRNFFFENQFEMLKNLLLNREIFTHFSVLILLDGYDESSLENQCVELHQMFSDQMKFRPTLFHIVLSTRPGYLSKYRGQKGRFLFADVLGFPKKEQKQKYISNHFSGSGHEIDSINELAVHRLLKTNQNLNKIAETPLFLTFICLVHERIIEGTLLELYFNIIWWLLDRHQKDFPDKNVPELLGFRKPSESEEDCFEIIQNHYLNFPQLHHLCDMALHTLKYDHISEKYLKLFNLTKIIQQVGLLRKNEIRDTSFRRIIKFYFPHRTVQEFLAAFTFLIRGKLGSGEIVKRVFHKPFAETESKAQEEMKEFERFLWRIAFSSLTVVESARRLYFFEQHTKLELDLYFVYSSCGISVANLNSVLGKCINITNLHFYSDSGLTLLINFYESIDLSKMTKVENIHLTNFEIVPQCSPSQTQTQTQTVRKCNAMYSKSNFLLLPKKSAYINLEQICFRSAKIFHETMEYFLGILDNGSTINISNTEVKGSSVLNTPRFRASATIKTSVFMPLKIAPQIFVDQGINQAMRFLATVRELHIGWIDLKYQVFFCKYFQNLKEVDFNFCCLLPHTELNFSYMPDLETMTLRGCEIQSNALICFENCASFQDLAILKCRLDHKAWESLTKEISKSAIKCLSLTLDIFHCEHAADIVASLKNCQQIENIDIDFDYYPYDGFWNLFEEQFTKNLSSLALDMKRLKQITIIHKSYNNKLKKSNEEIVRKAGQMRQIDFDLISQETQTRRMERLNYF